jgi:hypothetical protein
MGFEYLTNISLNQAREDYIKLLKDKGFGYKTEKTDGTTVYVWRLKGKFSIPDTTAATKDEGTDANGQEIIYTGINTTKKFTKTGKGAKAVNVDTSVNAAMTDATWFAEVQTPDTVQ